MSDYLITVKEISSIVRVADPSDVLITVSDQPHSATIIVKESDDAVAVIVNDQPHLVTVAEQSETAAVTVVEESVTVTVIDNYGAVSSGKDSNLITKIAGEILGGHRIVVTDDNDKAFYADSSNVDHVSKTLGLTIGSAVISASVIIRTYGEITESSWSWVPDLPIFLNGATGQISQTPPDSGFNLVIGFPSTSISMFIRIGEPIIL